MTSSKHIRTEEPILPFGPIAEVLNPHSVAWVENINFGKKQIICVCQNGGGTFMLSFGNTNLPFSEKEYILIQQKHNPGSSNIIKIKGCKHGGVLAKGEKLQASILRSHSCHTSGKVLEEV